MQMPCINVLEREILLALQKLKCSYETEYRNSHLFWWALSSKLKFLLLLMILDTPLLFSVMLSVEVISLKRHEANAVLSKDVLQQNIRHLCVPVSWVFLSATLADKASLDNNSSRCNIRYYSDTFPLFHQ